MLLRYDGADRAAAIANMVRVVARERAEHAAGGDWALARTRDDFVAMLRSVEAWTEGPEWDRVVVACPRLRPDLGHWTYVAGEVLDAAAGRIDEQAGDTYTFDHGRIEADPDNEYMARLVCDRKPNLKRAFHPIWYGNDPMVAVDLDGVTYYLNWSRQRLAVYIANRYPWRHDLSRKVFGHNLLLLAKGMRIDTVTAVRLSWLVAPNHCGVDLERNTALRILSEDEEHEITISGVFVRPSDGGRP